MLQHMKSANVTIYSDLSDVFFCFIVYTFTLLGDYLQHLIFLSAPLQLSKRAPYEADELSAPQKTDPYSSTAIHWLRETFANNFFLLFFFSIPSLWCCAELCVLAFGDDNDDDGGEKKGKQRTRARRRRKRMKRTEKRDEMWSNWDDGEKLYSTAELRICCVCEFGKFPSPPECCVNGKLIWKCVM